MQVTLSRVVEAARQRKAAVTAEAGGYIILLAVQRLAAQPRQIDAELIQLTAAGEILIVEGSGPALPGDAEAALRRLLATLVSLSHTAPPALRAAAERAATGGLAALESELTAALIPINHAASGRALARLFRETEKALRGSASASAAPSAPPSSSAARESAPGESAPGFVLSSPPSPVPAPVAVAETAASTESVTPAASSVQEEATSLEIDVEVVSSDDDTEAAVQSSSEQSLAGAPAPAPPVRSESPQLIVEELDELDVQELDAEEPDAEEPDAVQPLAALATAKALGSVAEPGRELTAELAAEARKVADELDVLLAAELPPPLPPLAPGLELSSVSGASSHEAAPASLLTEVPPASSTSTEPAPHRSDVRELLNGFLAHTRCEEEMTANLRRMIGLEPWRTGASPKVGPPDAPGRTP